MMDKAKLPRKVVQNAHKVGFIMQQYPSKKLQDVRDKNGLVTESGIMELLALPAVDINSALWAAEDLGYITQPNRKTGDLSFKAEPDDGWDFGETVDDLKAEILFCLTVMARSESDIEEFFVGKWCAGYPVIDILIAMKSLLVNGRLAEYEIKDHRRDEKGNLMFEEDENTPVFDTYIFYTLPENAGKEWGRKSFKDGAVKEA